MMTKGNGLLGYRVGVAIGLIASFGSLMAAGAHAKETANTVGSKDVMLRAMVDEIARSMGKLKIKGLASPYFIQINGQDRQNWSIRAAYGGLVGSDQNRGRFAYVRTRVGSYALDNTNIPRSFGTPGILPLDDDYAAIRHALWLMLDQDYKMAVEILAQKEAYLKGKATEDRPDDFTKADPVVVAPSPVTFAFDQAEWERRIVRLSARFEKHPKIQNSGVSLQAGRSKEWIVTSDGTQLQMNDTGLFLRVYARIQAPDGMRLSDARTYLAEHVEEMESIEKIEADIDEMCEKLVALSEAPVLEQYTGPVLFDPTAAGNVFFSLLSEGVCARPIPLGAGQWADRSFEKKLGLRILPRSFRVYDDPKPDTFEGIVLAGSYDYDDEATPAMRVELVAKGKLLDLLSAREPTKKIKKTNGHGRSGGFSDAQATVGCLYLEDDGAISNEELRSELIEAAKDEGLSFALRVESLANGGAGSLGNPLYAYKVDVATGKEQLVRGMRFLEVQPRAMKRILAAGAKREVYNNMGSVGSSIIAPAVVFEELDLSKIEAEFDKLPILPPPAQRH